MEGRWTLYGADDAGFTYYQGKTTPEGRVPVVPCDDAAVERGAMRVISEHGLSHSLALLVATDVLKAAGEATC